MSDASTGDERVGVFLRDDPDAFDALRDTTADSYGVDPGAVEKDYWATEVLRHATQPLDGVDLFVFKGGTSLSKAYGIIERFSEDIDLLVISALTGKPLKRLLRTIAERTSSGLGPTTNESTRDAATSTPATRTRRGARSRFSPPECSSRWDRGVGRSPTRCSRCGR